MSKLVTVFAPASVSNVGCGFDIFGFPIDGLGDEITLALKDNPGIVIESITGSEREIPYDPAKNTAGIALQTMLNKLGSQTGIRLSIIKKMPLCSGLGSSAASAAAAVMALNHILDEPLTMQELLPFVIESEKSIGGSAHGDNAAPALLGGFNLVKSAEPAEVYTIQPPESLYYAIIHPDWEVSTAEARQAMPKEIPLKNAIIQWANVGCLVHALHTSDFELLKRSIVDVVAEPVRGKMIPHFYEAREAALMAGAYGCSISGSGPAIFAFAHSQEQAQVIGKAMMDVYRKADMEAQIYNGKIRSVGAEVIRCE